MDCPDLKLRVYVVVQRDLFFELNQIQKVKPSNDPYSFYSRSSFLSSE